MQSFLHHYIKILLPLLCIAAAPGSYAQTVNKPQLSQSAPAGTQTNTVPVPPAINVNTSGLFNYQRNFVPKVPISDPAQLTTGSAPADVQVSTQYLDGFARIMQTVAHNFTPGKSLVSPADSRFRVTPVGYLPYSTAGFGFRANGFNEQRSYYNNLYPGEGSTAYSYTENTSTASKRTETSYAPGKSQVGQLRGTEKQRITNGAGEVRRWSLDAAGLPVSSGYYSAGRLFGELTRIPGETNNSIVPYSKTFKDREGRVVLQQATDTIGVINTTPYTLGSVFNKTYYVYNSKGLLCYIIPPGIADVAHSNGNLTQIELDQYCFQYRYDEKGRKVEQKIPGKDWEFFVYDNRGRLVLYQDALLRAESFSWSFTVYEGNDRPIATGIAKLGGTARSQVQKLLDEGSATFPGDNIFHYLNKYDFLQEYPPATLSNGEVLSYTYYETYKQIDPNDNLWNSWNSYKLQSSELQYPNSGAETPERCLKVLKAVTGILVKILPSANSLSHATWRRTAFFYDSKSRQIYSAGQDVDENQDIIHESYSSTQYNFDGQTLVTKQVLINSKSTDGYTQHTELNKNEYDATTGRLSKTWRKVDNAASWILTGSYTYDELGRTQRKILGNSGEIQDYSYNIRGQLTGINGVYAETGNKLGQNVTFGESLKYDYGFDKPRYDGKIAGMVWRGSNGANLGNNISSMHAYGYDYDLSGRLKLADYYLQQEYNGQGQIDPWNKTQLDFTVSGLYYDRNGNILSMKQRGVKPGTGPVDMDLLSYKYTNGNQLEAVKDQGVPYYGAGDFQDGNPTGADYNYDGNGNLKVDENKGIDKVSYNFFNKPQVVHFKNGGMIEYSYDATGAKIQELVLDPNQPVKRTDYVGNFVYQNDTLQYALTAGGRTVFDYSSATPVKEEYFVKDHLGNVRNTIDIITYEIRQYLATYEVASANLEGMLFEKVGEIRDEKPASTDPGDSKAGRLNGAEAGREVGTSLLVKVMAGDRVDMNVNNYYETFEGNSTEPVTAEQMMESIISTLTNGVGGLPGESHNTKLVSQLFTQENFYVLENLIQDQGIDPQRPQAFLTYALFDENMRLVSEFAGAYQVNGNGTWGSIGSNGAKVIPANGYLAIYLNSRWRDLQCIPCSNMFFDKLRVEVSKGNLLEENHYYPHGLPIQPLSSVSTGFRENRRKYQGNEYIKDLGLNWMDFQARQYDPQIGRFLSVDPLADAGGQQVWSPYAAMGNAPESTVDPNGTIYRPITMAHLTASDMLTSNRPNFFPTVDMFLPGGSMFGGKKLGIDWGESKTQADYSSFWNKILGIAKSTSGNLQIIQDGVLVCNYGPGGLANDSEEKDNTDDDDPDPQQKSEKNIIQKSQPNQGKNIGINSFNLLWPLYPVDQNKKGYRIEGYENECSIRLSFLLALTGTDLSSVPSTEKSPKGYILTAMGMAKWLASEYGPPVAGSLVEGGVKVMTAKEFYDNRDLMSQKGIIYAQFNFGPNNSGTGHIDLWDGNWLRGGSIRYLYNDNAKIWFWPLK